MMYNIYLTILSISFFLISWYFYVEDRFLLKITNLVVSNDIIDIKAGDIIRVGVLPDGSIASHWLGRTLHHYLLVINIEMKLYVIHTWYKKLDKYNNIHIPPSYQIQPIEDYITYSNMKFIEIFRRDNVEEKVFSMNDIISKVKSFGNSVRCYITIMNLLDILYPELNIDYMFIGNKFGRNYCLWSFFLYKPLYFEKALIKHNFKQYGIYQLENIIFNK